MWCNKLIMSLRFMVKTRSTFEYPRNKVQMFYMIWLLLSAMTVVDFRKNSNFSTDTLLHLQLKKSIKILAKLKLFLCYSV